MAKRINQPFPFQGPPKFNQIVIFGLKIYHLATLAVRSIMMAFFRNRNPSSPGMTWGNVGTPGNDKNSLL
jgi:hypothetical protein